MSNSPKIMALQEIQEPPPALAEALSPEFLRPLRIVNPPAIRIAKRPTGATWGGFCEHDNFAEHKEVVLHDPLAPWEPWLIAENLQKTYLHECSHRFLSGYELEAIEGHHGPVFFATQLLLFLRLPPRAAGRPWFLRATIYDLQDAWSAREYTPGQGLDWACRQAQSLSDREISAESAAEEIARRFAVWRSAMAAAPGKRRAKEKEKEEELARVRNKLFGARIYLCVALSFSFFLFVVFFLLGEK